MKEKVRNCLIMIIVSIFLISTLAGCFDRGKGDASFPTGETEDIYIEANMNIYDYVSADNYLSSKYISESEKDDIRLTKYVIENFHSIIRVVYHVTKVGGEPVSVSIEYGTNRSALEVLPASQLLGWDANTSMYVMMLYMWLNDRIPAYYLPDDYYGMIKELNSYLLTKPSVDEVEKYLDDNDLQWLKELDKFEYTDKKDMANRSKDNTYIGDVLSENYFAYNNKLQTKELFKSDKRFLYYTIYTDLFVIYKEYGDAVWGQEVNGEYVIEDYDKMFGALDQKIMDEFDLAPEDFR